MKNHEYYFELISLKIDNMLTADEESELNEHLLGCSECADRLKMYRAMHGLSEDLLVSPPENFINDIMSNIQLKKKKTSQKRRIISGIITVASAAAVLTLLFYTGVYEYLLPNNGVTSDTASIEEAEIYAAAGDDDTSRMFTSADRAIDSDSKNNNLYGDSDSDTSSMSKSAIEAAGGGVSEALPTDTGEQKQFDLSAMPEAGSNLFDPSTAEIGDEVAGFRIAAIEIDYYDDTRNVQVVFEGETTLSGTLYHDNNELGYWGKFLYFYIDDDCAGFLPYPVDDNRQIWFGIDNYDEAVGMLDTQPEDEGSTIEYQAVIVIDSYTVVQGATEGCNFASLKSILTLNRLEHLD